MAWTTPITWAVRQQLTAAQMNEQVRDNINYLNDNKQASIDYYKATDDGFSTTSTSYQPTGLSQEVTLAVVSTVVVLATFSIKRSSGTGTARLHRDSTEIGDEGLSLLNSYTGLALLAVENSLASGTYTYTLKLKSSSGSETAYVTPQTMLILVFPE